MTSNERRMMPVPDRRLVPRGGRRPTDIPGRYPPVLVVDSDASARRPCVRYLNLFGFQVEEAADGEEALAAVRTYRPHIVVTEARLPRGGELTPRLATEFNVPFIVTITDETAPIPPEAFAVLLKPFPLGTLLEEVRKVLSRIARSAQGTLGHS
jgi:two-component system response regulator MprA